MDEEIEKYCPSHKLPKVADMERQFDELRHNQCLEYGMKCGECGFIDCKFFKEWEVIDDV